MGEKLINQIQPKGISEFKSLINALKKMHPYKNFLEERIYREISLYLEDNPGKENPQIYEALSHGKGRQSTHVSVHGNSDMSKHSAGNNQGRVEKRKGNRKARPY